MPTLALCEEVIETFKQEAKRLNQQNQDDFNPQTDICFVYGITREECHDYFDRLIEMYSKNVGKRYAVCTYECRKKEECRFWTQYEKAKEARIVITTHKQYDNFYNRKDLHKWHRVVSEGKSPGGGRGIVKKERGMFIIDEDFVLSTCYAPIPVDFSELRGFTSRLTEFLAKHHEYGQIAGDVFRFFGQVDLCDTTSIIPAVNKDFSFPSDMVKKWRKVFRSEYEYEPEIEGDTENYGNYLGLVQHAMRLGAVVQKYGQSKVNVEGSEWASKGRNVIYFPNPTSYDLSRVPPHVFLDGTMLDETILENKLRNVKFKPLKVDFQPLWNLRVWQNVNTDLAASKIEDDKSEIIQFVSDLVAERGVNHKYFFLTNKKTRDAYLDECLDDLKKRIPGFNNEKYVTSHYKKLRGVDKAKDCDICVMLGSVSLSDAVEIATALEFIQNSLPKNQIVKANPGLWTWKVSKGRREYKPDYSMVEEFAKALRLSEHRQGLARTRYLYHEVDFYILSRDPIETYEPFLSETAIQAPRYQYRADLFRPRQERPDSMYPIIKQMVFGRLALHGSLMVTHICRETNLNWVTVKGHLNRMVSEGYLVRDGKKYTLPDDVYSGKGVLRRNRIIFDKKVSTALNRQSNVDQHGFPFTLDLHTGCFFACRYCNVPDLMRIPREQFTKEVVVKTWMPGRLDHELHIYLDLPQHLKRVRINESCESYLPAVMKRMNDELERDLMAETLQVFERHWAQGNQWMLHIMTKSHLVLRHLEILSKMKHMVQIEMSFPCLDEKLRRKVERYAPSIKRRLEAVQKLSNEGIFVRVMAMPFVAGKEEGEELKEVTFNHGAKAFSHKGLSHYGLEDLMRNRTLRKKRFKAPIYKDLIINSGEFVVENGERKTLRIPMPERWKIEKLGDWRNKLIEKDVTEICWGYSECNDVDWGYIC
jgi:DNA repair photolyase/predicted transcriptional regulator